LYSLRFSCNIVSLTAAKTNRIFSVSIYIWREKKQKKNLVLKFMILLWQGEKNSIILKKYSNVEDKF
jgi:hypothetical protein